MYSLLLALALTAPPPLPPPPPPGASGVASPLLAEAPPPGELLRGDWGKPSGKRVTLTASVPVNEALDRIADAAGWNLVLNTGGAGARTLTLKLRDVPAEDALRAVLTGSGLVATRSGATVVVAEDAAAAPASIPVLSGFDPPTGRRFSADFDDEEIAEALKQIASSAGLSIVLPPGELEGSVTATFKDVPVEDALRAVLTQGALTAERQGQLILVHREGLLGGVLPPGLSPEARHAAEDALRKAQRSAQDAMRKAQDAMHGKKAEAHDGRDREVTGEDLTIYPGEDVRDVSVVKGNLRVMAGASVRDAAVVLGRLVVDPGASARDAVSVLGGTTIGAGSSARDAVAVLGDVDIGAGAQVAQDAVSVGGHVRVDPGAQVRGSTHSLTFPGLPGWTGKLSLDLVPKIPTPIAMFLGIVVRFAVLFVLGLAVLAVAPGRMEAVSGALVARPLRSLLTGVLGTLGMPVLALLLIATGVGILLVPVQVLLALAGGVLGITALTHYLGRLLPVPPARRTLVLELAAGTLIFSILTEIPVVGWMVWVATWFVAFGAVLRTRFGQPPAPLATTVPPPA